MPDKFKNIIKSFTEKGSALRPIKSSTKNTDNTTKQQIQKVKEKTYGMYGGGGSVKKTKYIDEYGNKHKVKESTKTYRNPLNDEQVTVSKIKNDGKRSKEVHRDRDLEPMREPMKEAVARAAGEVGPMAADRIKGMIGTPADAPKEAPIVSYKKPEAEPAEDENKKREEILKNIKKSKQQESQYKEAITRIKKRPRYEID